MIFIIIGLIMGLIFLTSLFLEDCETIIGKILSFMFGIPLGAAIGALIGFVVAGIIGGVLWFADISQERKLICETPIYSVIDNQGIEGHFMLGCGNVNSKLIYYYIIKNKLGEKVQSVNASNTHLINIEEEPKIKTYYTDFKHRAWWLIGFNFKAENDYILEVPKNTIKYQYNIDLK